jgi:hypothetical protein
MREIGSAWHVWQRFPTRVGAGGANVTMEGRAK